jgi:signal transduction histidine kinase
MISRDHIDPSLGGDAVPATLVEPVFVRSGWREWATSFAGRIMLIVLLGLAVFGAIPLGTYVYDRTLGATALQAESIAQRVISVVETYEAQSPLRRRDVPRLVSTRYFTVSLRPQPPPLIPPPPEGLTAEVGPRLQLFGDRPVRMWPTTGPEGNGILVAVAVTGGWLIFDARPEPNEGDPWVRGWTWAALAFAILSVAFLLVRRTAAPVGQFALAADRFGTDVKAPPLPEAGSSEVRRAIRAFNRMQERLRRYVDDRTMMMAAISHDLRTALTRLKLRAEFIDDTEQRAKAVNDLDEMQQMLESTLAFARDEAVQEPRSRVDLAALLQSLCADYADGGKNVRYQGPDRTVFDGRPVALRRAFANLIENAVRYGNEALVTLSIDHGTCTVRVEDCGPGIPLALRERVFAPFYRIEGSRSRETGGMGLGLAVVRSVVRGHGGDITLGDREGGGLVVRIVLPGPTQH